MERPKGIWNPLELLERSSPLRGVRGVLERAQAHLERPKGPLYYEYSIIISPGGAGAGRTRPTICDVFATLRDAPDHAQQRLAADGVSLQALRQALFPTR